MAEEAIAESFWRNLPSEALSRSVSTVIEAFSEMIFT